MVKWYLRIGTDVPTMNMIETAQAVKILGGKPGKKLSSAPERDQAIFKNLREMKRDAR